MTSTCSSSQEGQEDQQCLCPALLPVLAAAARVVPCVQSSRVMQRSLTSLARTLGHADSAHTAARSSPVTMDERVAQLAFSTRHLTYPHYGVSLQLQYKECYIIHSGQHAVDYTGLRLWPGAHLLAHFILDSHHSQHSLQGQVVCELGAGLGLCGLLVARYANHVALTDRVQAVLDVIDRNIALNQLTAAASSHALEWSGSGARSLLASPMLNAPVSIVIAADVIYPDTADESMHALFDTVTALLSAAPSSTFAPSTSPLYGRFVLSYVNRSAATCRRFLHIGHSHHYTATHISQSTFLFDDQQRQQMSTELQQLHGYILLFERTDERRQETSSMAWLETEPFASMMTSEKNRVEERARQHWTEAADEDDTNVLPMSGYEEEAGLSAQHEQSVTV